MAVANEVFLGFDVGTSSSKGVAVDASGRLLGTAVRHHEVDRPAPGMVAMDGEIWWQEFCAVAAELAAGAPINAATVAQAVCQIRQSKLPDPKILANAGSFFKNPLLAAQAAQALLAQHPALPHYPQADGSVKLAAGWLIEQCGLKGFAVGDAAVHDKQALVLVNRGRARAADVAELVRIVCGRVQQRFGVALEMEPIWLPRPTAV